MTRCLGWLLGYENAKSIDSLELSLAAPWASAHGLWVVLGCLALAAFAVFFYRRYEQQTSNRVQAICAACRAALLVLLLLTLAAPVLSSSAMVSLPPLVYVVVDDTESMGIADLSDDTGTPAARSAQLRRLLSPSGADFLRQLQHASGCRMRTFTFTGDATSEVREVAPDQLTQSLTLRGQVTDLTEVLRQLSKQPEAQHASAVLLFSDFVHNADTPPPVVGGGLSDLISSPIHAVGVGAAELLNAAVELRTESWARVGQPTTIQVDLQQQRLTGRSAKLVVQARALSGSKTEETYATLLGERTVTLDREATTLDFDFLPTTAGLVEVTATVWPLPGETVPEDNVATQTITVLEEPLRLLYLVEEPTWEWRFLKEVFHRDQLVGEAGFRTYLAASDPRVRGTDALFLPTLPTPRQELFTKDVLLLDGAPQGAMTPEFCALVEEFVGQFGGGLIVLAEPGFGLSEWAETPLAQMLPVVIDSAARRRDGEFNLRLTPTAQLLPFMRLGDTPLEHDQAWHNLGPLPWYQPVAAVHEQARVLAEHPADLCADGRTHQPLLALRSYGRGQVAYLGFNELWRLRRRHGDRYYQRFWSQLIYHLGMGQAVGADRRFVVRLDRHLFQVGETALCTVAAFDEEFRPLPAASAPSAELLFTTETAREASALPLVGDAGRFEASVRVEAPGDYVLRITDPVTSRIHQRHFRVARASRERQRVVRDVSLQRQLAAASGGKAYELAETAQLLADLKLQPTTDRETRHLALWNTPLWFIVVVGLMLGEWSLRKFLYLR